MKRAVLPVLLSIVITCTLAAGQAEMPRVAQFTVHEVSLESTGSTRIRTSPWPPMR
jgi:hypothetical protein